jgi:cytochrome c551/c552/glucose/arabinose dehydrogenase
MKTLTINLILFLCLSLVFLDYGLGQTEDDYYRLTTVPVPEGVLLEGGGLAIMQDGSVALATRRGDIWIVSNPSMQGGRRPIFHQFASGLHEPLGLLYHDGAFYTAQRGELTKLSDTNGDRIADLYETVYRWPLSGHYHEYSYGPVMAPDSSFFVTTNVSFGAEEWYRGMSDVPWRGWAMRITMDGKMEPWAAGMRSPAGYGIVDGELFYTDNQGDWVGSGAVWHVPKGAFMGHPASLAWTQEEGSPVTMTEAAFYAKVDKRQVKKDGAYVKPQNIEDEENPDFLYKVKEHFPELQLPAVILPHGILGISNSEVKVDQTGGKFGPFTGQVFVGDQGQSKIMRVAMEKVNGEYQGVAFDFRTGFQSGVMRMDWDHQGNLFVGETNRGWGSAGPRNEGLEFLTWTGEMPFEMKTVKALPDGFEIEFTMPVDKEKAKDIDAYAGKSYIYKYHAVYGSPQTNMEELTVKGVQVSENGMKVRIVLDNLRPYYVHEFHLDSIQAAGSGQGLLHPAFYYTLNQIPAGKKLASESLSTFSSKAEEEKKIAARPKPVKKKKVGKPTPQKPLVLSDAEIQPLLQRNTCIACHKKGTRVIGPSYQDIAKRKYSNEKIVELIYKPQPKNWPEYATPMAPMPQVPKAEALKIAAWINSLRQGD